MFNSVNSLQGQVTDNRAMISNLAASADPTGGDRARDVVPEHLRVLHEHEPGGPGAVGANSPPWGAGLLVAAAPEVASAAVGRPAAPRR